jgi:small subunit ribosomal protein S6
MIQNYELMLLCKPILIEDIKKNTVKKIEAFIEKNGGKLSERESLGKRLLAYPVKKFSEGNYIEYGLSIDAKHIDELTKMVKTQENILRFLILKK